MKKIILTLILIGSAMLSLTAISSINKSGFTLIRTENNIALSSREIKLPANYSVRELRAEFVVVGTATTMFQVLCDEEFTLQWMKGVKEFSIVSSNNENEWLAYIQYQIPWPLRNQDCIADYLPVRPGIERISHMSSRWTIYQCNNNMSRVVYTVYSEQKPRYPRWATDPVIQINLINTLTSLREMAESFLH